MRLLVLVMQFKKRQRRAREAKIKIWKVRNSYQRELEQHLKQDNAEVVWKVLKQSGHEKAGLRGPKRYFMDLKLIWVNCYIQVHFNQDCLERIKTR